ncbi:MAG: hypothetical protein IKZ52_03605 [Bacteroidales bacterium]|nr:hypothetical protein [Bacteroidales bacterium]
MLNKEKVLSFFHKLNFNCKDSLLRHFKDESNQYNLAPVYIERKDKDGETNPKYGPVEDIANKLGDENVRNIALTGPYGSGKSSVLRTLMRDYPKAKYLSISLATLEDDTLYKELIDKDKEDQQKKGKEKNEKNFRQEKDEINHLIEYSILQQIIYKEKASKLRQSRLKRIQDIRLPKALIFAGLIVLAVIATIVLFEPKFLMVESLRSIFSCSIVWEKVWDFLCVVYLVGISIFFIGKIFVATYNSKVNKLNFKDGEISIAENTSVFNKHLDEIIYFFEVTKYNVVIIEDLDRFETTHIFLKLRELNQLLNSSNSVGRRIVFIYAVRDDIFNDTNRTKFFDYITTVIPVINYSNAKDMLLNALQQHKVKDISESTCKELGLYIDDMRMLYNIVDEYIQYSTKLGNSLETKNLLGMIVYKNYFPDDFSALPNRGGAVYKVISSKKKYQDEVLETLRQKKKELEDKYVSEKNKYQLTNGKELRSLYVNRYLLDTRYKILYFVDANKRVSPQELIDDEKKFQELMNDNFSHYEYTNYYNGRQTDTLNLKFEKVEKQVDSQHGYLQRLNFENEVIREILNEIKQIDEEISICQQKNLAQLLNSFDIKAFQKDISEIKDKNRLVEFLLKKGYINEYYYDYISYFYPATLTPQDKEFITDLRVGRKKEYPFQLVKLDSVIDELSSELYNKVGILNISLIKYIADHSEESKEMSSRLDRIIKCIEKHKEKDFVLALYSEFDDCEVVFARLFKKWKTFYKDCIFKRKETNKEEQSLLFEAFMRYADLEDISKNNTDFDNQISNCFGLINERLNKIGLKKVETYIQNRNLKFKDLISQSFNPEFMKFIIDGCYFERNKQNLLSIVSFLNPDLLQSYKTAGMTITRRLGNTALVKDMDNNLLEYIGCFPEESIEESEESLLYIINNSEIDNSVEAYLDKQRNRITNLSDIPDNDKKRLALKTNVVEPKWENIEGFIKAELDNIKTKELISFISKNIEVISNNDVPVEMAKLICRFYQEGSLNKLSVSKMIMFTMRLDDVGEKIRTFISLTGKENADDEMIKMFLNALGGVYKEIAVQKGTRPKMMVNDFNKELLQYLERVEFISSYKEKDNMYRVITKNI